jgi:hypothetical protein
MTFLTIVSTPADKWEIDEIPLVLRVARDQIYIDNIFDGRIPEAGTLAPMHAKYGIDTQHGGIVVVRPDGAFCHLDFLSALRCPRCLCAKAKGFGVFRLCGRRSRILGSRLACS